MSAYRTHCRHGHPYVGGNIYWSSVVDSYGVPRMRRNCKACKTATNRAKAAIRKETKHKTPDVDYLRQAQVLAEKQDLEDRIQGNGYPVPLPWEREELQARLDELVGES